MYRTRQDIDWRDEVFGKTGITQNHNVSITGGNERTNFMVSYNYTGEDGIMDRHNYSKTASAPNSTTRSSTTYASTSPPHSSQPQPKAADRSEAHSSR